MAQAVSSNKRIKVDSHAEAEETDSNTGQLQAQHSAKAVDSFLLSSLQNELKYQVYGLWRQLNLIETYDDSPGVDDDDQDIISFDAYNDKLTANKPVPLKCCIECFAHIPNDENLVKHHRHRRCVSKENDIIKNYHYVPVLEMDHSGAIKSKISSEIIKKVYKFQFTLYCRLCLGPIERETQSHGTFCPLGLGFYFSLDKHLSSPRHTLAVKEHFKKPENFGSCELPEFLQIIMGPFKSVDDVEMPNPSNIYDPHVFLMSCCCRMAVCRHCETAPYIFESSIPPDAKSINCNICKTSFPTSFGNHLTDIQMHVRLPTHKLKRRNEYVISGYIPHDTKLFRIHR